MGNAIGRMTALTMLTPIRPQWVWFMRLGFLGAKFFPLAQNAILKFDFIHYVRWAIVDGLPGERLRYRYLLFESNFDGPWQHYIDAFAYVISRDIRGGKMTIPGDPPYFLKPQPRFVSCRGGEYLLRPSIGALRALADGL
jgi:hypothetical protein